MPESPEQRQRRLAIWAHNSHIGKAAMIKTQLQMILKSQTATAETKRIAHTMLQQSFELADSLKTRSEEYL